jgi:hypothetical protein
MFLAMWSGFNSNFVRMSLGRASTALGLIN